MGVREALRRIRAEAGCRLGVYERGRRLLDGSRAAILMYHRVLPRETALELAVEPGMYVTPETFRRHLRWLRTEFHVLPLGELVDRLERGEGLPSRCVAITFDDGWRDNYEFALPALREAGLPATIFLVARRVGTRGAFWPDEVSRRLAALAPAQRGPLLDRLGVPRAGDPSEALIASLKTVPESEREGALAVLRESAPEAGEDARELLDWDEVSRMSGAGVDFESHGATHAILTGLDDSRIREELDAARGVLAERGLGRGALFAYPSGAHDPGVRRLAREAGHRAAVTTDVGYARLDSDRFALPRIGVHEDVSRSRAEFMRLVLGLPARIEPGARRAGPQERPSARR